MIRLFIYCTGLLLMIMACNKKEEALLPSDKDVNYLVVHDNPNDVVDHTIYELYKKTGVPIFYNDTLSAKQVGDSAGVPQYFYIRLLLTYSPVTGESSNPQFTLLPEKQKAMPMLNLLESELLPVLPAVPSILLTDSLFTPFDGGTPIVRDAHVGFNTVAIRWVDTDTMSTETRDQFILSVLRTVAIQKMEKLALEKLETEFYSISNKLVASQDAYYKSLKVLSPNGSKTLEDFGFISSQLVSGVVYSPIETRDLEAYVNATITNTPGDFNAHYANYPVVLKKFELVRSMLTALKFKLPN